MSGFLIGFFTLVLVLASLFMIFVVLLQRGSSQSGAGTAFGGGAAESAFGGETNKVLVRATVTTAIVFFVVGLGLYLGQIAAHKTRQASTIQLETVVDKAEAKAKEGQAPVATPATPVIGEATAKAMKELDAQATESANKEEGVPLESNKQK